MPRTHPRRFSPGGRRSRGHGGVAGGGRGPAGWRVTGGGDSGCLYQRPHCQCSARVYLKTGRQPRELQMGTGSWELQGRGGGETARGLNLPKIQFSLTLPGVPSGSRRLGPLYPSGWGRRFTPVQLGLPAGFRILLPPASPSAG